MAKELIAVTVKGAKADLCKVQTDLLAVGMFEEGGKLGPACSALDSALDGWIGKIVSIGDFKGKAKSSYVLYGDGNIGARRVVLVGLGKKKDFKIDGIRKAAEEAAAKAVELKSSAMVLALNSAGKKLNVLQAGQAVAEGVYLGAYKYDELMAKKEEDERPDKLEVTVADCDRKGVAAGAAIGAAQAFARTLANRPANLMYPEKLADEAKKMARGIPGLTCTVFGPEELKRKKMGGILAVGQGADRKPRMVELRYTPTRATTKAPTIALVGKGITFDSGGISIKPSQGMHEMKLDMGGAAAVVGAMQAIARLKLPVKVYGIVCTAENMPGGGSYRPGDVITTYSGKTVEIQNTDAEGRMVMSDGIHYARELKCDVIVDVATLTGACMVALGQYKAGVMSNNEKLSKAIVKAAEVCGEAVWPMPCGDEYTEEMKSEIADLKNIGGKWGGACTAASFLREFAGEDVQWAHLDIAGPGMYDPAMKSKTGSRGFGVRLLTELVRSFGKKK